MRFGGGSLLGLCILPDQYGGSSLAVGVASFRLLLCYGGSRSWRLWDKENGVLFESLKGTGTPLLDGSILGHSPAAGNSRELRVH